MYFVNSGDCTGWMVQTLDLAKCLAPVLGMILALSGPISGLLSPTISMYMYFNQFGSWTETDQYIDLTTYCVLMFYYGMFSPD